MGMFLRRGAPLVTLEITCEKSFGSVIVKGREYTENTTLRVPRWTPVTAKATWNTPNKVSTYRSFTTINVNGETVASGPDDGVGDVYSGYLLYKMPALSDTTLVLSDFESSSSGAYGSKWTIETR